MKIEKIKNISIVFSMLQLCLAGYDFEWFKILEILIFLILYIIIFSHSKIDKNDKEYVLESDIRYKSFYVLFPLIGVILAIRKIFK